MTVPPDLAAALPGWYPARDGIGARARATVTATERHGQPTTNVLHTRYFGLSNPMGGADAAASSHAHPMAIRAPLGKDSQNTVVQSFFILTTVQPSTSAWLSAFSAPVV
jgi:hypothetical protein